MYGIQNRASIEPQTIEVITLCAANSRSSKNEYSLVDTNNKTNNNATNDITNNN